MYDLSKLCRSIAMPEEVTKILLSEAPEDTMGFATLKTHLEAACAAWERYQKLGIPEEIYIATMAAFSRFVREHKDSFGVYGFDRGFWTTRQTGCVLFRIGELEYELRDQDISLHIPSDTDLSPAKLRSSWAQAAQIICQCFPDHANLPMTCHSWLLSPDLPGLLPPGSRILGFQRSFTITEAGDDGEFKQWVYGRPDIPNQALPEKTTLQRKLKAFLGAGNTFHSGRGVLKADPFVD